MADKDLRKRLIRLAYERPELRPELLPLITRRATYVNKRRVVVMHGAHASWFRFVAKAAKKYGGRVYSERGGGRHSSSAVSFDTVDEAAEFQAEMEDEGLSTYFE
jgi:hypothetical protein